MLALLSLLNSGPHFPEYASPEERGDVGGKIFGRGRGCSGRFKRQGGGAVDATNFFGPLLPC